MKLTDEAMLVACHLPPTLITNWTSTFYVLIAGAVGVFSSVCDPVLMGGMSRIVAEDEQGTQSNCPANNVSVNNGVLNLKFRRKIWHMKGTYAPFQVFVKLENCPDYSVKQDKWRRKMAKSSLAMKTK